MKLPEEPPIGLLMSMAIRYDHALMSPDYYDQSIFGEDVEKGNHEKILRATLATMRQLYEEVSGHGFYSPEKEEEYAALVPDSMK